MPKAKAYAIVIGRLLWVGLLLIVRWCLYPLYFVAVILQSLSETAIDGMGTWVAQLSQKNNELLNDKR